MNNVQSREEKEIFMQAIIETLFDVCNLASVITIGIRMVKSSKNNRQFQLFGWMAIVLGAGDSFHLIPRMIALCTTGLENFTVSFRTWKMDYFRNNDSLLCSSLLCMDSCHWI